MWDYALWSLLRTSKENNSSNALEHGHNHKKQDYILEILPNK